MTSSPVSTSRDTDVPRQLGKVVVACSLYDYGKPERGFSFEYYNLYLAMKEVVSEVVLFDFYGTFVQHGKEGMNRALVELLKQERPDVTLVALFGDEFTTEGLKEARKYTTTVAYFFDDIWRREFVARWVPHFDHFTTSSWGMYRRYQAAGLLGVIHSPFGYNGTIYVRKDVPLKYDVSFVGGCHPWRQFVVDRLRKEGIAVAVWGSFWPTGKIDLDTMIETFSASKINLNLSNSKQWDARYLLSSWRAARNTLRTAKFRDGVKARHFEIPGSGGFQLSYYCEDLERHFQIGDEVAVYLDVDELLEKVRYYLEHEGERQRIANAGHARACQDHRMETRLSQLLMAVRR
jgi:spore maturation protein CgeB